MYHGRLYALKHFCFASGKDAAASIGSLEGLGQAKNKKNKSTNNNNRKKKNSAMVGFQGWLAENRPLLGQQRSTNQEAQFVLIQC